MIETFAWETQAGFAVHVLNYTNPTMHRGWIRNFYPIGAQKVKMTLPQGRKVTRVELLRAEADIPFTGGTGTIEFTIPQRGGLRSGGDVFGVNRASSSAASPQAFSIRLSALSWRSARRLRCGKHGLRSEER